MYLPRSQFRHHAAPSNPRSCTAPPHLHRDMHMYLVINLVSLNPLEYKSSSSVICSLMAGFSCRAGPKYGTVHTYQPCGLPLVHPFLKVLTFHGIVVSDGCPSPCPPTADRLTSTVPASSLFVQPSLLSNRNPGTGAARSDQASTSKFLIFCLFDACTVISIRLPRLSHGCWCWCCLELLQIGRGLHFPCVL